MKNAIAAALEFVNQRFSIPNPCHKRWIDLPGDGRARFCPECHVYVPALNEYSDEEIERLKQNSPGPFCGYLAGASPELPRTRRAVLVGALLTAITPLMAQSGLVRIRVTDVSGAPITNAAEASVMGADGKPVVTARSNDAGEILLTGLPKGDSRILISSPGFQTQVLIVTIRNSREVKIDAILYVSIIGETVAIRPQKKRKWWWPFR